MRDLLRLLVDLVLRFTHLPLCLTLGALMVIGLMVMHSAGAAV
ncbi:rod shape-determining protein RodA, partial [Xylella fastidiosa subsp. multiplex]|nr:rod shape-determining protein RodA [Xylella fastidiosa subsp. multiplex]